MWKEGDFNWMHYVLSPIKSILLNGSTLGNFPLWFLLSLLAVQLIFNYLSKKVNVWLIVILGFSIAYGLNVLGKNLPLYFANVPLGIASYGLGYKLKETQYRFGVFALACVVFVVILSFFYSGFDFRTNQVTRGLYQVACLYAVSGCIIINYLFARLKIRIRILEHIGRHSMNYYVMHWPVLLICSIVAGRVVSGWCMLSLMVLSCVCIMHIVECLIYHYHSEWIFGENINRKANN